MQKQQQWLAGTHINYVDNGVIKINKMHFHLQKLTNLNLYGPIKQKS